MVKGLEAALSSNDVNGKAALHAVEKERIRLEVELEAEKKDRHTQVSALSIQHAEELEKLHKEHQAALSKLRVDLGSEADATSQALRDQHQSEIDALKTAAQETAVAASIALKEAVAAQKKEDDAKTVTKLSELDQRLKHSAAEAAAAAAQVEEAARSKLISDHAASLAALQEGLQELQAKFSATSEALVMTQTELDSTQAKLKKTEIQAAIDKEQLVREGETCVRQEKEASQRALLAEKERNDG